MKAELGLNMGLEIVYYETKKERMFDFGLLLKGCYKFLVIIKYVGFIR